MAATARVAIASVVIAGVALAVSIVVAIAGTRQARRQRQLQERLATLEEDRRRDELLPHFEMWFLRRDGTPSVEITNRGPLDYADVSIEIVQTGELGPPIEHLMIGQMWAKSGSIGALPLGAVRIVQCGLHPTRASGLFRLRITAADDGGQTWTTTAECDVPPTAGVKNLSDYL